MVGEAIGGMADRVTESIEQRVGRAVAVLPDKQVIACNYTEATKVASKGALCYVIGINRGNGSERIEILARSRGGRWIEKWESIKRLNNFRLKTLPQGHPRYNDERLWDYGAEKALSDLLEAMRRGEKV